MTGEILVKDIMSRPVTIAKSAPITDALDKMLDEGVDPLIVVNHDSVVGTVSRQSVANKLGTKKNSSISPTSIHVADSSTSVARARSSAWVTGWTRPA